MFISMVTKKYATDFQFLWHQNIVVVGDGGDDGDDDEDDIDSDVLMMLMVMVMMIMMMTMMTMMMMMIMTVVVVVVLLLLLALMSVFAGGDCGGVFRLHPRSSCGVPLHRSRQGNAWPAPQSAGEGVPVATALL